MGNTHESFEHRHSPIGSSDRSFGVVFSIFFLLVAIWPIFHHRPLRWWALPLSLLFLLLAIAAPALLHPLNLVWTRLGLLLARITNPIVTAVLFFLVFTPAAFLLRLLGKDPLHLRYDPAAASYWILRDPPGPDPESMRNQF